MTGKLPFSTGDAHNLLRRTPIILDAWLRDLPEAWLHANEGADSFSSFDVVGHLIYGERSDWITRVRHILSQDKRPFRPFDRFGQQQEFVSVPLAQLLDQFADLRASNLRDLEALAIGEEQLGLHGLHPEFGEVTLRQLLATWVVHDQGHIAQIARVLAKHYGREVGPWAAYLTVLSDRSG